MDPNFQMWGKTYIYTHELPTKFQTEEIKRKPHSCNPNKKMVKSPGTHNNG